MRRAGAEGQSAQLHGSTIGSNPVLISIEYPEGSGLHDSEGLGKINEHLHGYFRIWC